MSCYDCGKDEYGTVVVYVTLKVRTSEGDTFQKDRKFCQGCFEKKRDDILNFKI